MIFLSSSVDCRFVFSIRHLDQVLEYIKKMSWEGIQLVKEGTRQKSGPSCFWPLKIQNPRKTSHLPIQDEDISTHLRTHSSYECSFFDDCCCWVGVVPLALLAWADEDDEGDEETPSVTLCTSNDNFRRFLYLLTARGTTFPFSCLCTNIDKDKKEKPIKQKGWRVNSRKKKTYPKSVCSERTMDPTTNER